MRLRDSGCENEDLMNEATSFDHVVAILAIDSDEYSVSLPLKE